MPNNIMQFNKSVKLMHRGKVISKNILIITTLAVFITLSLISVGCRPSEASQFVTYTDKENGFSIDYPDNWHIETPSKPLELKVSIYEKKVGLNPVGIMVGKYQAPGYDLESFIEFRKDFLSDTSEDYAYISTEQLTINGITAIKHFYAETVGPTTYEIVEVCLIDNETGWIVRFNSPEKSFDSYKTIYDTAFNSFRLLK
ncbi:MAG: hypothetical protein M1479_00405 [Actinobacteria bacterium]|nr:hypothetical protein [Actinomycetota bacterium]